jgi:hypothetical protein
LVNVSLTESDSDAPLRDTVSALEYVLFLVGVGGGVTVAVTDAVAVPDADGVGGSDALKVPVALVVPVPESVAPDAVRDSVGNERLADADADGVGGGESENVSVDVALRDVVRDGLVDRVSVSDSDTDCVDGLQSM